MARYSRSIPLALLLAASAARTVQIPLSFLGAGGYRAMLVRDNPEDPAAVRIEDAGLTRADSIKVDRREGGGFTARFSK